MLEIERVRKARADKRAARVAKKIRTNKEEAARKRKRDIEMAEKSAKRARNEASDSEATAAVLTCLHRNGRV